MYHVNDTDKTYSLDYILTFSYNLSYPDLDDFNGDGSFYITSGNPDQSLCGKSAETTEITVETPQTLTEDYYKINLFNDPGFVDGFSGFTGSVDGRMYFKFTESSTSDLHGADKDNYEHGNYTAVVKFFVEGV